MFKLTILLVLCIQCATSWFTSQLLSVNDCKDPVPPYADKRMAESFIRLVQKDNRTLLNGNITYSELCNNCKWSIYVMKETNGVRRSVLRFKDMNCKHILVQVLHTVFGIPVDFKTCTTKLGTYVYKEIDLKQLEQKIRLPVRSDGTYLYTYSVIGSDGTQICYEARALIKLKR